MKTHGRSPEVFAVFECLESLDGTQAFELVSETGIIVKFSFHNTLRTILK